MELLNNLTADTILEEKIFTEVFEDEDEIHKARMLLSLTDRAKELGVKGKFETLVKVYKKQYEIYAKKQDLESKKSQQSFDNYTQFGEDYPPYYCGNWIADLGGVRTFTMFGETLACYHPILPVQRLVNAETGKEKVKLAFKKGARWKEIIVDKGIIASNNKIVSLADYGVSVTSETSKALVRYLSDLENFNIELVGVQKSTSKLGWIDGGFMPYSGEVIFDNEVKFKDIFDSVCENGNRKVWYDLVRGVRALGRIEANVYLAGSFASVLIEPLDALPFILNVWGDTGKGKTVSLMLAASVWANPKEGAYMTDPRDSAVALEVRCDVLNSLPMIMDDLSKRADKFGLEEITDLVYMLCGGKGKGRSDVNLGLRKTSTWKNITMTNIERPLATETMRGGAVNRIVDIEMENGDIFQKEGELSGNAIVGTILRNYGFAGRQFIEIIEELGIEQIKQIQQDYMIQIRELTQQIGVEKEEKQIAPLSILLTADKIATDYLFKDGIYLDINKCIKCLKNKSEVSEHERAFEYIMSEISINMSKFKPDSSGEYKGEIWGCIEKPYVIIQSNAFNRMCERGNFSNKAFLSWAARNGKIKQDKNGKNTVLKRLNGPPTRCVWLQIPEEDMDFEPADEQERMVFEE